MRVGIESYLLRAAGGGVDSERCPANEKQTASHDFGVVGYFANFRAGDNYRRAGIKEERAVSDYAPDGGENDAEDDGERFQMRSQISGLRSYRATNKSEQRPGESENHNRSTRA